MVRIATQDGWELPASLSRTEQPDDGDRASWSFWQKSIFNYSLQNGVVSAARSASIPGCLACKKHMPVFSYRTEYTSGKGGNEITDSYFLEWMLSLFNTEIGGKPLSCIFFFLLLLPLFYLILLSKEGTLLPCWTTWLCLLWWKVDQYILKVFSSRPLN